MTNTYGHGSVVRASGSYGWVGIEVFFVISGFIIPYAMAMGGYELSGGWRRFMAKRLVRLEPPYLASVLLALTLWHLSAMLPTFGGKPPPSLTSAELWLHLGYLNGIAGYPWLNVVYWTLALEFQFYLLASVAFGALSADNARAVLAADLLLLVPSLFLDSSVFVFRYLPLFMMGIVTFQYRSGLVPRSGFILILSMSAIINISALGGVATAAAIFAVCVVMAGSALGRYAPLLWLGSISYSLYLIHVPVGGRVVNFGRRFADSEIEQAALSLVAIAVCLAFAHAFFVLIERPFQRISARIKYRREVGGRQ